LFFNITYHLSLYCCVFIILAVMAVLPKKPKCYHWRAGDEDSVITFQEELREQMEEYLENIGSCFNKIKRQSKMIYNLTNINYFGNKYNIEYTDEADFLFFHSLVNQELLLRKLPLTRNL
jgi:hypothetical protein